MQVLKCQERGDQCEFRCVLNLRAVKLRPYLSYVIELATTALLGPHGLSMLINQNLITVGVGEHQARWAGGRFVNFIIGGNPSVFNSCCSVRTSVNKSSSFPF